MKNMINANAGVTFALCLVATINIAFAIEGNSPMPDYVWTVFRAIVVEIGVWAVIGAGYLIWVLRQRRSHRRLGILRYDGRRGEWYYQR